MEKEGGSISTDLAPCMFDLESSIKLFRVILNEFCVCTCSKSLSEMLEKNRYFRRQNEMAGFWKEGIHGYYQLL